MFMAPSRRRATGWAATLLGGSAELIDFLVPLWGGVALGVGPAVIGLLVAVELIVSVLARPLAGMLVDTRPRTRVAALGAGVYGLGSALYVAASSAQLVGVAFAAAALGGIGGAFFWVAARAIAAESLGEDSGSLADFLSSESLGSWFLWIPAMVALPFLGVEGVFGALAAVCGAAAVVLLMASPAPFAERLGKDARPADAGRRVAPVLVVALVTATAETGVGLLLLLYLQDRGLEIVQIALVYLPGGIALTLLPRVLHRVVERHGRRAALIGASLASATTALCLAFQPPVIIIAILWVVTCAAWAVIIPLQQAVVAEVSGDRMGWGMSLLSNVTLIGAAAGAIVAGAVFGTGSWWAACAIFSVVIASGAITGPLALHSLGAGDQATGVDAPSD